MPRRILVAGATGEAGRPLALRLLAEGHRVRALVHRADGAADLATAGAVVVGGDARDPDVARDAAEGCDVVVHAAATPPRGTLAPDAPENAEAESRWREGTAALLAAAGQSAARFVLLSLVTLYADGGDERLEAADPEMSGDPALAAVQEAELATFGSRARFLVLRQGLLVSHGSGAAAALRALAASGAVPHRRTWVPLLHPDDLAMLVAGALAGGFDGVFDAVSAVAPLGDVAAAVAEATGAPAPEPLAPAAFAGRVGAEAAAAWSVSRRVEPGELSRLGLRPSWGWEPLAREAAEGGR